VKGGERIEKRGGMERNEINAVQVCRIPPLHFHPRTAKKLQPTFMLIKKKIPCWLKLIALDLPPEIKSNHFLYINTLRKKSVGNF
jgi:hypothetical protein